MSEMPDVALMSAQRAHALLRCFARQTNKAACTILHCFARDRAGATAVEFALVAVPFFALVLAALQVFVILLAQQSLETVAEKSGRLILTGQVQAQGLTQSQFQQEVCTLLSSMFNCSGLMIDVQNPSSFATATTTLPTITYNAQGSINNTWQYSTGTPGSIIVLRIMYPWPVFSGLGFNLVNLQNNTRLLMATAVFKNESALQ